MKHITIRHLYFSLLFFVVLVVDQMTKLFVASESFVPLRVVGDFFRIIVHRNTGIALSIPLPHVVIIFLIPIIILMGLRALRKEIDFHHPLALISISLILAGALGNMLDRLRLGYVVDFIAVSSFPVFNVADIAISCGIMVLFVGWKTVRNGS